MENWKFKKIRVKATRPRAPHKVIHSKVIFGGRRKTPSYLFGKIAIDDSFEMVAMSVAGLGLVIIARVMSSLGIFGPGLTAFLVLMSSIFGSLVLATLVHGWLERHFAAFKPGKILGVGLLALASFIAHGQAVGEVNAIFEIDASALPHTTAVASAMVIGNWLFYAVLLPISVVSVVCALRFYLKSRRVAARQQSLSPSSWLPSHGERLFFNRLAQSSVARTTSIRLRWKWISTGVHTAWVCPKGRRVSSLLDPIRSER